MKPVPGTACRLRGVKRLALAVALLSSVALPSLARAEIVPGSAGATDSLLAVGADGEPRVAFTAPNGSVVVAARAGDGSWKEQTIPGLAGAPALVDLEIGPGGAVLLAQATAGGRLTLAEERPPGWLVRTVASSPRTGVLGFGGLALDHSGRPVIAYAYVLPSRQTSLHLVQESATGRLVGEVVTRKGFPPSVDPPTVTPVVLPGGAIRIVEAYSGATIEWARTKNRKDWIGQFLYANPIARPGGVVRSFAPASGGVWSAVTELFPDFGESQLVLTQNHAGQHVTILDHHAFLVGLAQSPTGPEAAADDYVDVGGRTVFAGLVLDAEGGSLELAGHLQGYAVDSSGARHYLLLGVGGVDWYRSATPPLARVVVSVAVSGGTFALTGRVSGATGGDVEIWRETQAGAELAASLPLGADGGFSFADTPLARPVTYRAVYRNAGGPPVAALLRTVIGS
jgi:hypothetical protein